MTAFIDLDNYVHITVTGVLGLKTNYKYRTVELEVSRESTMTGYFSWYDDEHKIEAKDYNSATRPYRRKFCDVCSLETREEE